MPSVEVRDVAVQYEEGGAGPPVVLIAGTGYPGRTWPRAVVEHLAERYRVLTYDHRGTGGTSAGQGPLTTRSLAADAASLLAALTDEPARVIGHSMGGRVAQWLAHDASDRVSALVLAASGPGRGGGVAHRSDGIPISTVLGLVERGYADYVRELQRRTFFTDGFADQQPEVLEELFASFWDGRPDLEQYLRHVIARQSHDATDVLPAIDVPTLVVVGELDTHEGGTGSHVQQSQYLARAIADARFEFVPGTKHGFFWERPTASTRLILDWLASVDGADQT